MKDILLVNDVLTKQFDFLRNGSLSRGMQFRDESFYYLASFNRKQQQSAFDLAWVMSRGGKQRVVVTATKTQYKVWLGMRSPVSPLPSPEAPDRSVEERIQPNPTDSTISVLTSVSV
jgi:hypothetical protein